MEGLGVDLKLYEFQITQSWVETDGLYTPVVQFSQGSHQELPADQKGKGFESWSPYLDSVLPTEQVT